MEILSHRGLGFEELENSKTAFEKALSNGFGLEMDVLLSKNGQVVISHELAEERPVNFHEIISLFQKTDKTVAVHLKKQSEEVWRPVCQGLRGVPNIFLFDPTIKSAKAIKTEFPEIKLAFSVGEKHFSETIYYLDEVINLSECDYIWWDEWETPGKIYNIHQLKKIREAGKKVYAISPELHSKTWPSHKQSQNPEECWKILKEMNIDGICTDYPMQLREFINK